MVEVQYFLRHSRHKPFPSQKVHAKMQSALEGGADCGGDCELAATVEKPPRIMG